MASRSMGVSEARDFKAERSVVVTERLVLPGVLVVEEAELLARVVLLLAGLAEAAPAECE